MRVCRRSRLCLERGLLLLLLDLEQQRAVDVGQDTAEGDGGADQGIELLVAADGKLQVAGRDALDLEVLRRVLEGKRGWSVDADQAAMDGDSKMGQVRCVRGVELTPANSSTSAVRYSSTAVT